MNKKGQIPYMQEIFAVIVGIIFLSALIPLVSNLFNQNCPKCEDCSPYKNQLSSCQQELENPEVVYINNTIEVPVIQTVEKEVYKDTEVEKVILSLSLIISLSLTLLSFKIKLPRRLEERLDKLEDTIILIKYGSLILSILIFIKLAIIFNLL